MPRSDLQAFVGRWTLITDIPGAEGVRGDVVFELMGVVLVQRTSLPVPRRRTAAASSSRATARSPSTTSTRAESLGSTR
jgi:hypothetical protein